MNCAYDKEKLSGYYDGELDAAEKAEVERHIASCSECLRELGELKSAALLVKELPRLRAPRSIAEGVKREIQAAGKVHRFAAFRKNLMWMAAAAAALLVVLNVAYFSMNSAKEADAPVAAQARPAGVLADSALPRPPASRNAAEELRRFDEAGGERRALDRAVEQKPVVAEPELRKNLSEGKAREFGAPERAEKDADRKPAAPTDAAKAAPAPEPTLATPPPPGAPAPKPAAAAPVVAAKEEPRPFPPAPEKPAEAKRDGEGLAKGDADLKAKKSGTPDTGADAPAHFTLASTQMAKARPQVEATLRKLGVALPEPSTPVRGGAVTKAPAAPPENTYTLEMTDSQIAKLREEIAKQSYSRLLAVAPGDPVLVQYGDAGLFRSREKSAASGGAAAPPPAPAKKPKDDAKEAEDAQAGAKVASDKLEKSGEPRRKVVLHLMEVLAFPDPQPAGDPVKK